MFYDDELEACADKLKRESLCNWSRLPSKGFPIVFEGIKGRDMREEKSPSFFNPEEAAVVVQYVKDLKDARGINVLTSEIGIISPYRKQVQINMDHCCCQSILYKKNFVIHRIVSGLYIRHQNT